MSGVQNMRRQFPHDQSMPRYESNEFAVAPYECRQATRRCRIKTLLRKSVHNKYRWQSSVTASVLMDADLSGPQELNGFFVDNLTSQASFLQAFFPRFRNQLDGKWWLQSSNHFVYNLPITGLFE
ncbi:hypothetical protein [Pseudomonas quasicaspiana]|uniref:hypothetical protein n=1 Tax=Pseudomonas quasicaspiana TaxID=2829821 RepID=UPI001E3A1974|nr:hypothetical protein [Pseudomonas quasicaspiana]